MNFCLRLTTILFLLAAGASIAMSQQAAEQAAKAAKEVVAETKEAAPVAELAPKEADLGDPCQGGVALDDGSVETGYGFVPSAKWGEVLQRFESSQFTSRKIDKACVCWLHTGLVDSLDFEIVFYEEVDGRPTDEPYARIAGRAEKLPKGVEEAGRFYPVAIKDVTLPEGGSYIGVRFVPSDAKRIFVCTDKSETSKVTQGFQREDRAKGWDDVLNSRDWIFDDHKAILLRATAAPAKKEAPKDATTGAGEKTSDGR